MKADRLMDALGKVKEDYIMESAPGKKKNKTFHFRWIAAVIALVMILTFFQTAPGVAALEIVKEAITSFIETFFPPKDNPESFAKAFQKFHGITPSQARGSGVMLKSFSRLSIKVSLEGGSFMNYRIEEKPAMLLTGYKRRFTGSPNDKQDQDHNFACETRLQQYILEGMCREHETTYQILTNFDADGYDFYYAYQFPKWALEDMEIIPADVAAWFENVSIPAGLYIVCETERCKFPTAKMEEVRIQAVSEWLPTSGYELRDAPEIGVIHWYWEEGNEKLNNSRYCELWLPIAKK